MGLHTFKKGLQLPIAGTPVQQLNVARQPSAVAVIGDDYTGLRATIFVSPDDDVRRGQLLFKDKKTPSIRYTAPAAGTVTAVNRGDRRALQSVVIKLSREEREERAASEERFRAFSGRHPSGMTADDVKELLVESGVWPALRARPFGRVANPETRPHSIFVTAMATDPLAPAFDAIVSGTQSAFDRGLAALGRLTDGPVFVCTAPNWPMRMPFSEQIRHEKFAGPHPSGTVGLHIHTLDPVHHHKIVWYVGFQDVVMLGRLFETGVLDVTRIISLAGPPVKHPRLLQTRLGASLNDLVRDELDNDQSETRMISGSVFSGRAVSGAVHGYLGRYHQQISVLREGRKREFMGWLLPGLDKFSMIATFASKLLPGKRFGFTTSTNGSKRAIVPIGMFEQVMPLDIMPTPLLRALVMEDVERAEELGCLELDEEDVALCTFVCAGKNEYGPYLRRVLNTIENEG